MGRINTDKLKQDRKGDRPITENLLGSLRRMREIPEGECVFQDCTRSRLGGKWHEGGSWCCAKHRDLLMPVRCLFDRTSPEAIEAWDKLRAGEDEAILKAEERAHRRLDLEDADENEAA